MDSKKTQRRHFIQMASRLLAIPFAVPLGAALSTKGHAASSKPPLRLLTILDSYGIPAGPHRLPIWAKSTANDYDLRNADLGTILTEFRDFKDNMLVISGIDLAGKDGNSHDSYTSQALTGSKRLNSGAARGSGLTTSHASLDVHIGSYINNEHGLLVPRAYPNVFLSSYAERNKTTFCFDERGNQIRSVAGINSITSAFLSGQSDSNTPALDNIVQQEILGLVQNEVQGLRGQLLNANKNTVLDAYQTSVQQLAREIELRGSSICAPFEAQQISDGRNISQVPAIFDAIAHMFQCDLASSITYSIGGETINQHSHGSVYNDAQINDATLRALMRKNLHASSHRTDDVANKSHELTRIYQAQQIATVLRKLQITPDSDGSSMFDNTVLFWTSAMSNNTHRGVDYPYLLIAGKNSQLRGGRHYQCSNQTNNDLLTTIAQGMMLPDDHFGGYDRNGKLTNSLHNGPISKMLI